MLAKKNSVLEMPADAAAAAGGGAMEYAGFWARVAALLVDSAILTIVGLVLLIVLGMAMGGAGVAIGNVVLFFVQLLYWPVMESSARQATIGKGLLGIQVTDLNGGRLSFVKALLRNLAKIISSIPFGIGFLLPAFTARKQALHDIITSCLVVRAGPSSFLKAVVAAVGGLVIAIGGTYYYVFHVLIPQQMGQAMKGGGKDLQRQMEQAMREAAKGAPQSKAAPSRPSIAKAPSATPKPAGAPPPAPAPQVAAVAPSASATAPAPKVAVVAPSAAAPAVKAATPAPAGPAAVAVKPEPAKSAAAPMKAQAAPVRPAAAPAMAAKAGPKTAPAAAPSGEAAPRAKPRVVARKPAAPAPAAAPPAPPARTPKYNDVMTAVMNRDRAGAAEALELGIWVDRPAANGVTPLMVAAMNGDAAMTELLLKHGADPNRGSTAGSVLAYAMKGGDGKVIALLKKAGAH